MTQTDTQTIDERNRATSAAELVTWAEAPARYAGYVTFDQSAASRPYRGQGVRLTTWMGDLLGTGAVTGVCRNNLTGSRTVAISIRATNGHTYTGRFGDEWSQLCRVRRA
jgi:hypothetical protein